MTTPTQHTIRAAKRVVRDYLKLFTDSALAVLLVDARAGRVPYLSCCHCLVGHRFGVSVCESRRRSDAYCSPWPNAGMAESLASEAYYDLGIRPRTVAEDVLRQRRLVPMVLAECSRRERARQAEPAAAEAAVCV